MTVIHFTGIKGSGMSSLAQILFDTGERVQGSDVAHYFFTEDPLRERGIPVLPFDPANIQSGMQVIAGNAYSDEHPELVRARELGVPIVRYHEFLGAYLTRSVSVAVTGAHGKTSTTGQLAHVLAGYAPTSYLIGDGTGRGEPDAKYFVMEACEYRRHFLAYHPDYAIMTNVDFDHPDYFRDLGDVSAAFQEMAYQVRKAIIAFGDDLQLQQIHANVPIVYYGFEDHNDFEAKIVEKTTDGTVFDVYVRRDFYGSFYTPLFGDHAVLNALAVIALCHYEGIPQEVIRERLANSQGVKRRFTETQIADRTLIDDYAHHPTEIHATIQSARQKFPNRQLVAIFQPHTFTRTAKFLDEFAASLSEADRVYVCDIFGSAREAVGSLTIEDLRVRIPGAQKLLLQQIEALDDTGDAVLLFMGAGDVQKFQRAYELHLTAKSS